jgi:L-lactate dehydrogenase complex protein LldE
MRISLFITCFNDTLFPETGKAMVRLLERLGHSVEFLSDQTCCGQMHYNTGYQDEAISLVRNFISVFGNADVIVAPSASCVAMVHEFYPIAAEKTGDLQLKKKVEEIIPRVFELSDFLVNKLGIEDVGAYYPHKVTFHPTRAKTFY